MKNNFILTILLLSESFAATAQWLNHYPNPNDTFAVSQILTLDQSNVYALGYKMLINDDALGVPKTDSLFLFRSSNGGNNWQSNHIYFGNYALPTRISVPSDSVIYIGGVTNFFSEPMVIKSNDNGQSWSDVTPPPNLSNNYINILKFYDNDFGVVTGDAYADEFTIFHTYDGGNSWTPLPTDRIPDAILSEFSTAGQMMGDNLWFTTNYGRIYKSADRGYNWEVHQSILNNLEGISFSDTLNGIALYGFITLDFNTSPIIITADGGKTWEKLDISKLGPKTGIFGACYIPNSSYIMLTTAKNSLLTGDYATWISPDRGETWQQISSGENIYTLNFLDASTGWGGGWQQLTHPARMFKYTGSPLVGIFSSKTLPENWSISPNPCKDHFNLQIETDQTTEYLLLINDVQGKLVYSTQFTQEGNVPQTIQFGSVPAGTYVVTLTSKDGKVYKILEVY